MNSRTTDPAVRHDAVLMFDVTDGNPNGNPDEANRPRVDAETNHGLVTDVCLKRKVRDTIGLTAAHLGVDPSRYQIFIEAGHALNTRAEESYTGTGLKISDKVTPDQAAAARAWLTNRYADIRLFGAVLSTGQTRPLGQIRGPIQFGMARSIDPVNPVEHTIIRVTQTTQADIDKGQSTEMGSKWTIPYALYTVEIHYSATRGQQTGVTSDDLIAFYTTLLNMFDHDRTATRGIMTTRGLHVFNHTNPYGNAPSHTLTDRITITRTNPHDQNPPRTINDYKITLDDANLPQGVNIDTLIG